MDPFADIDLDSGAVWLDDAWYTREELARRIKEMIEAGDFRVSRPSQALERLEAALAQSRVLAVRMPAALAGAVDATAARLERPTGHLVREAIAYYLAAAEAYAAQAEAATAAEGGVSREIAEASPSTDGTAAEGAIPSATEAGGLSPAEGGAPDGPERAL
jgi:predicted DNA-binding protein